MDEWGPLRIIAAIAAWVTVGGGLVMAGIWFAAGGARALDPNEELMAESGARVDVGKPRRLSSFSPAQLVAHGFFGIAVAGLLTYGLTVTDDRRGGYGVTLVVIAIAATLGTLMYLRWRSGERPRSHGARLRDDVRPEDRLPTAVVYAHGAAAVATAALVLILLVVD